MKTIPSLVASSTVGIAPVGLAIARLEDSTPTRPTSKKRKAWNLADVQQQAHTPNAPALRPSTASVVTTPNSSRLEPLSSSPANLPPIIHQLPLNTRADSNSNMVGRRWSIARQGELSSSHEGDENRRDSVSSRGSWMKRLSNIQISRDNSPRSSIGPDSPSLTFSYASGTPMLSNSSSSPAPPLPPNKLVKRVPSQKVIAPTTRDRSKSALPTMRRPATSYQRSFTLQQQFREQSPSRQPDSVHQIPLRHKSPSASNDNDSPIERDAYRPFFESRPTKLTKDKSSPTTNDEGSHLHSTLRRVILDGAAIATLVNSNVVNKAKAGYQPYYIDDSLDASGDAISPDNTANSAQAEDPAEAHKRARRSLSMTFSSPGSWALRSASLRGKRKDGRNGDKRYSSAPVPRQANNTQLTSGENERRVVSDPSRAQSSRFKEQTSSDKQSASAGNQHTGRNGPTPLPPLSRLSSFNIDLARLGLSSSSSAPRPGPGSLAIQPQNTSISVFTPGNSAPNSPLYFTSQNLRNSSAFGASDRTSTLIGSDLEIKGFTSGDDDEMDFQSETVFDSLRSGATGSTTRSQLDAMFDESPPSTHIMSQKRLSIHELLNGLREVNDRIIEEEEETSTPVKGGGSRNSQDAGLRTPVRQRNTDALQSSPPSFSLASKDFGRLSLDDEEEDEDWTRDEDENPEIQSLSIPSSSLNSRKVSPSFLAALADLTDTPSANDTVLPSIERPRSSLFDWSEPSTEKTDYMGNSPRPKTAHSKHMDGRGGRSVGRRGPNALHIRSQSVPVVPDLAGQREQSKLSTKFGTWGLGAKGVSEEWDGDFEFDGPTENLDDVDSYMANSGMVVPRAIQESQDHVVGHVGQIREVCLLVDDLKRLRVLANEKGLLQGPSASLWKEAEGIIALAVPDEEDPALSPTSPAFPRVSEDYSDREHDGVGIDGIETVVEVIDNQRQGTEPYEAKSVRRKSVFSPDDDIFGAASLVHPPTRDQLRPPFDSPRHSNLKSSSEYARTVMETMHQHRATSDPQSLSDLLGQSANKMPFDTTSLRDLVNRASALARSLSELIRNSDGSQSPDDSSRRDSSPAFTRVFTPTAEAMANPATHLPRSESNTSILNVTIDSSPTRNLAQRMHMMTVV
ncbi:hypothetical protein BJ878DRAFT_542621 [Calycina marina]|uniref:Uncharacterized protein n=1 Tax=Calycina marina TaxID=1763456 RepID=A0A9P7Z3A7_9HELO|nr:hypothetical protein BJ878DRAFT_542621 [Calycina marina]